MASANIGGKLRELRKKRQLPLREVAASTGVDVAILSKMERGERHLTKILVHKLAKLYDYPVDELMVLFLSEKVVNEIGNEGMALKALQVAEEQIGYATYNKVGLKSIIKTIKAFFEMDKRIKEAWIFGSFARGDENHKSDIDIMVRFNPKQKISLFDFADIVYQLEEKTKRKIDMVEEGCLQPFAFETAGKDLIKIYG